MYNRLIYYNRTTGQYEVDWQAVHELLGPAPEGAEMHPGPFKLTTGRKLATTWWGQEWIDWCEEYADNYDINKGRQIGRYGVTLLVRFAPGEAAGVVSEDAYVYNPHAVKLTLPRFTDSQWRLVDEIVTSRMRYNAALMAGDFPEELLSHLLNADLDVFETPDFHTDYTDATHATPEGMALAYTMAAMIDTDPLLLFQLRGRSRDELLMTWLGEVPPEEQAVNDHASDDPMTFWLSAPLPAVNADKPDQRTTPPNLTLLPSKFLGRIPQVCRTGSDFAAARWDEFKPIIGQDTQPVFSRERIIQQPLKPTAQLRYDEIVEFTDTYCQRELDDEFQTLANRLTHVLAAQTRSLIATGNPRTWACAIMYALAETNDLFEQNPTGLQTTPDALCDAFGMSTNTTASRSRRIRQRLDIIYHDPRWTHSAHASKDPHHWLVRHHGMLVDRRQLPEDATTQDD